MGNRALIATEKRDIGIYLHWNGGRDTVEPLLRYCELQGYRAPSEDSYGWARLAQVMGNFFGGSTSIGLEALGGRLSDPGDNSVYIIEGWRIKEHLRQEFDQESDEERWVPFPEEWEQRGHPFDEMLRELDQSMPKDLQLGGFLDAPEVPTEEIEVGDEVYVSALDQGYELHKVVGVGADVVVNGIHAKGVPYVGKYVRGGDPSRNPNNYLTRPSYRVRRERQ